MAMAFVERSDFYDHFIRSLCQKNLFLKTDTQLLNKCLKDLLLKGNGNLNNSDF